MQRAGSSCGAGEGRRRCWGLWEDVPVRLLMKRSSFTGPGVCLLAQPRESLVRPLGGAQAVPMRDSAPGSRGSSCSWNVGADSRNCPVREKDQVSCLRWGGSLREDGAGSGGGRGWTRGWTPGVDGSTRCSCPTRRWTRPLREPGLRCGSCWRQRFPVEPLGMPSIGSELPGAGGGWAARANPLMGSA